METLRQFKFTFVFILSIIVAVILYVTGFFDVLATELNDYGYLGAFIAGILFSSTFTSASAAFIFIEFGEHLNPYVVATLGGLGAMCGDLLMYRFLKHHILSEIRALITVLVSHPTREKLEAITKHEVYLFTVPFLASILIASPLPDELGLALFSTINFHPKYLSAITLFLNATGIFLLVTIGYSIG